MYQDLIEGRWDTARILREYNAGIRRCAIERLGWDRFITDANACSSRPARAGPRQPRHMLALYDLPERIYDAPVRVLLCTNATPERDGQRRRFGLTVPASITDPVSAAAWTFGLGPTELPATPTSNLRKVRRSMIGTRGARRIILAGAVISALLILAGLGAAALALRTGLDYLAR